MLNRGGLVLLERSGFGVHDLGAHGSESRARSELRPEG